MGISSLSAHDTPRTKSIIPCRPMPYYGVLSSRFDASTNMSDLSYVTIFAPDTPFLPPPPPHHTP